MQDCQWQHGSSKFTQIFQFYAGAPSCNESSVQLFSGTTNTHAASFHVKTVQWHIPAFHTNVLTQQTLLIISWHKILLCMGNYLGRSVRVYFVFRFNSLLHWSRFHKTNKKRLLIWDLEVIKLQLYVVMTFSSTLSQLRLVAQSQWE